MPASHTRTALLIATTIAALSPALTAAQARNQQLSVDQRLQRVERLLDSRALVDLLQRVDTLQREIQRLQGENEVQAHQLETLTRRQEQLSKAPQPAQEHAASDTSANPDAPANGDDKASMPSAPVEASPTSASADPAAQQQAYKAAFQLLRDGNYAAAVTALQQFLDDYPGGLYAANAQYWIGEAHYVEHQLDRAKQGFDKVIHDYPDSAKTPDALLKVGLIQAERQQPEAARETFSTVITRFPDSTAATLARKQLR